MNILFAIAGMLAALSGSPGTPQLWSTDLVRSVERWTDRMNEAVVTRVGVGMRIEIASDKEWAISAIPNIKLPRNICKVTVKVRELSPGAKWLMRVFGDVRNTGTPGTVGLFESNKHTGSVTLELDVRVFNFAPDTVFQIQLGLEGQPGDSVVIDGVDIKTGGAFGKTVAIKGQISVPCVEMMPDIPKPFKIIDWKAKALAYDRFVFDLNKKGQYLPLIWEDDTRTNIDRPMWGLYSYVGNKQQGGSGHESINVMGAVLGATLVGIDKRKQEHDYVTMCEGYYNRRNGVNLVLNNANQGTGGSFWYEIWPSVLFYAIADKYPGADEMDAIVKQTADKWAKVCEAMNGNFDHTAFDTQAWRAVDNGQWKEPDAAAGLGWLEYAAYRKWKSPDHLHAAELCMKFLDDRRSNPYYEVMMPWGALTAARMNAEMGKSYNIEKMVNWSFGISDCRGGWGVIVGQWGGYDCSGLLGSIDNRGGYAFAMNTFAEAGALVPLVRYDPRFARTIGRWMLHLANSARLFYPNGLPPGHQTSAFWKGDPESVIAYEGLRHEWEGMQPCSTGDPVANKWGPETDLGLYGSSYVGMLGAIVGRTSDEKILQLDCLATDFYRDRAYPTYLYYNPYHTAVNFKINVGRRPVDLYDLVSAKFMERGAKGATNLKLQGDRAVALVFVPAGGNAARQGKKVVVNGVVVDYGVH